MFSQQTEQEITNNLSAVAYGCPVTLTAHAYNELLTAARAYDSMRAGYNIVGYQPEPGPLNPNDPPRDR